jgi:DNA replication and repair protein RecF
MAASAEPSVRVRPPEDGTGESGAPAPTTAFATRIERLQLTSFRNYAEALLDPVRTTVVLWGVNGAGKTNLLEAVSLLAPGQGLRRAPFADLEQLGEEAERSAGSGWSIAARLATPAGTREIGTGYGRIAGGSASRGGRVVRIDGESHAGSGVLADHVEMLWLTPTMHGLFTGPSADRRRFLDRLTLCFVPSYREAVLRFERAVQSRNRLLGEGVRERARFVGLEAIMAEAGVAIASARAATLARLQETIARRRARATSSPFPWAEVALEGSIDREIAERPPEEVEVRYRAELGFGRERDRAAGRALVGPHRTDFVVGHGPKGVPARLASTGEQKALLVGLVMAHAEMLADNRGSAPILLLDEITAHLDAPRREALLAEIVGRGGQTWMTGTDREPFAALAGVGDLVHVDGGRIGHLAAP